MQSSRLLVLPELLDAACFQEYSDESFPLCLRALEKIRALFFQEDDSELLLQVILQREAQCYSPRLKGSRSGDLAYTNRPFAEYYLFDAAESFRYCSALEALWTSRMRSPFAIARLLESHSILSRGLSDSGKIRDRPTWIGPRGAVPDTATQEMVPHTLIRKYLRNLSSSVRLFPKTHRIVACAMLHYQFTAIHPFSDGNGRMARLLTNDLLISLGLIDEPYLFITEILLARVAEYSARLQSMDMCGETKAWIYFFASALQEQAEHTIDLIALVRSLRRDMLSRLPLDFVNHVLLNRSFSVSTAARLLSVPHNEAQQFLTYLNNWYGLSKATVGANPIYQFGELHELLAV